MSYPKISISVPVYNVERYLRQCLDSLLAQTLQDIQIVLVDDGSTDSSGRICDEYADRDARIMVIHKANGGLASARQAALEVAKGEYFCACDADDWVEPDMYERMYQLAQQSGADVVSCDYYANYPDGREIAHRYGKKLEDRTDLLDDVLKDLLPHMIWNKLFKRDLFSRYNIEWEKGINMGEDLLMSLKLFRFPLKMCHVPTCLYHYRRVMGGTSYTNNVSLYSFKQSLAIRTWVDHNLDLQKYADGIFRLWVSLAFTGLRVNENMPKELYNEVLQRISYKDFFKYKQFNQKGMLVLAIKLLGFDFGRAVCRKLYHRYYR